MNAICNEKCLKCRKVKKSLSFICAFSVIRVLKHPILIHDRVSSRLGTRDVDVIPETMRKADKKNPCMSRNLEQSKYCSQVSVPITICFSRRNFQILVHEKA